MTSKTVLTIDEKDILQEVMNIAFGKASADLAEVIDIYVVLNIPQIDLMNGEEFACYLQSELQEYTMINLVEQNFWGSFKGTAMLIFPSGSEKELLSVLEDDQETLLESDNIAALEKEVLLEVGNILIGACVGKIAELLEDVVTYSPPHVVTKRATDSLASNNGFGANTTAILLKTTFAFERKNIDGLLFILSSVESFQWLKEALNQFLEQYE